MGCDHGNTEGNVDVDREQQMIVQLLNEETIEQSKVPKPKENIQPEVSQNQITEKEDLVLPKPSIMEEKDVNMNVKGDSNSTVKNTVKSKDHDLKELLEVSKLPKKAIPIVPKNASDKFSVQYSKTSRSDCQKCKEIIVKDSLRIGREMIINSSNHFYTGSSGGMGIGWWHFECFFQEYTSKIKWSSFEGVDELSVDDQKSLYKKACHKEMPSDLLAQVTATHEAVDAQNKLRQLKLERKMDAIQKREQKASRLAGIMNTSVDDVIRDSILKLVENKTMQDLKNIARDHELTISKPKLRKGEKKIAPKKDDFVQAIVKAQPLNKIASLIRLVTRRQMKIDELKALLDKVGLPKTGSKLELANRLLSHLGIEGGEECDEEIESSAISNGLAQSSNVITTVLDEKEDEDPDIVLFARKGDLESVKSLLEKSDMPVATLNMACKWTEIEQRKGGVKKSWTLHGETPLLAACRNGHLDVVYYLLTREADPTLEGCISGELNDSPLSAVKKNITSLSKKIDRLDASLFSFDAKSILEKLARYECIKQLLIGIAQYWSRATYAGAHYTDRRKKTLPTNANKPISSSELQSFLSSISTQIIVDEEKVTALDLQLQEAKSKEAEKIEPEKIEPEIKRNEQSKSNRKPKKKNDSKEKEKPNVIKVNPKDLSGNGLQYEGKIVNWMKGFGFLKVTSPRLSSDIYVHISDVTPEEERKSCRSGCKMKFEIVESDRKPGTFQAKNVVIANPTAST